MSKDSVVEFRKAEEVRDAFTSFIRQAALDCRSGVGFAGRSDESERCAVVRNGYLPERTILTGIGPIAAQIPKVRSRTEGSVVFRSALVPSYVRRAHSVDAALPCQGTSNIDTRLP